MFSVIIVDDDVAMQNQLKSLVRKVTFDTDLDVEIKIFKKYCAELKQVVADTSGQKLYLLDIELGKGISGIKIADIIRKDDWESEIIFLTNHDKMFETVYRTVYKVFDFIEKYYDFEKRVIRDLKKIINKKHDNSMFKFSNRKITLQIYYKDILYISRDKNERKLVINTTNNKFMVAMSMNEMMRRLDKRFRMVHRACIVNTDRVIEYNWLGGFFLLDTGNPIHLLSRKFREEDE